MSKFNIDSTLVVIPARGGSKRIPNKNFREIFGQPMIYWPLMEIQKIFNRENVLVSTDSDIIKGLVKSKGLDVPFMRPESLSDDFTGTEAVVEHSLKWYENHVKKVEFILTVYPTAVLLREEDIRSAMTILSQDKECDTVMSATNFAFPIQRAVFENDEGYAEMFEPKHYSTRSQDLVKAKHDAGQFYLTRVESFRNGFFLTNSKVKLHLLHRNNVVDIDTIEDFEIAEEKLQNNKKLSINNSWTF
jgi:pseudaminic acid cytidylyltransferase